MREKVGCHLWEGEQWNDQYDTYHPQASYNGQGYEHHQYIFKEGYGDTLWTGVFPIESDVDNRIQEAGKEGYEQNGYNE